MSTSHFALRRNLWQHAVVIVAFLIPLLSWGQIEEPIKWTQRVDMTSSDEGTMIFSASIDRGWHMYGLKLPDDGPRPTRFTFDKLEGVELVGDIVPSRAAHEQVDMIFHLKLSWWDADVSFSQKFKVVSADGSYSIAGKVNFQGCDDSRCIPPQNHTFDFAEGAAAASVGAGSDSTGQLRDSVTKTGVSDVALRTASDLWAPVEYPESSVSASGAQGADVADSPWWYIFIWGFIGGLLALLTPCVWPMIPLTVSFFLKRGNSRKSAVGDALIYGLAIVVIYLLLGLAITMIFGAGKLNDLATNAVFNILFFLLLVVFAISFFGAFEITLPSKWSNAMDNKAERTTGLLSIFFMAFTLALVSFSCTGPIIGTLLVEAASMGDITGPAIGMGAFALALAIPFAIFALFPSMLKEMPRSGGWLNSVKVVLGFLELALSLKFLSVADLAYGWGILDREVFVSLWVVIFVLLGMYLLGKLSFSHDSPLDYVPLPRFFLAMASLAFAIYLVPGLWGAPLKGVSAFVPPLYTQDFNLYSSGNFREFDNYDEGMAYASEAHRPVLIDFSGYGCVNCRKMEGAVFDTQEISEIIKDNFVMIKLMVDDKKALAEAVTVQENGKDVKLETVGELWSYLQRHKFKANSQPFYIILGNDGQPLVAPYYYDESVEKFAAWLNEAIQRYAE